MQEARWPASAARDHLDGLASSLARRLRRLWFWLVGRRRHDLRRLRVAGRTLRRLEDAFEHLGRTVTNGRAELHEIFRIEQLAKRLARSLDRERHDVADLDGRCAATDHADHRAAEC